MEIDFKFKKICLFFISIFWGLFFSSPRYLNCMESGFKYITNYSQYDYGLHSQNWWILQDKRGIIYAANQNGILEFDGVKWRIIRIPNESVRSLAVDETGTVYVGGKNEIGFLAPDSNGTLQYVSLSDYLEENQKNFSMVWRTLATEEGIYFSSYEFLFRWNPGLKKMNLWKPQSGSRFFLAFTVKETLFIQQENVGLMRMERDKLKIAPGGEEFKHKTIRMMTQSDGQKILIGTRDNEFFLYDGQTTTPLLASVKDYLNLNENQLYRGIRLSAPGTEPGEFALATLRGGLVIIDSGGYIKTVFDKSSGLQDNRVHYVFEDIQGNLWLALEKGICKIEYASPFSIYDERSGLPGTVQAVVRHKSGNVLYAGTTYGLYFLESPGTGKFYPVPGIINKCWHMVSAGNSILVATERGVAQVDNNRKRMVTKKPSYFLLHSRTDENRVWVGTVAGLSSLSLNPKNSRWRTEYSAIESINREIRSIAEDSNGNLWLGALENGVVKVDFPGNGTITDKPAVTQYTELHGLPPGEIYVCRANDHVIFATPGKGIFQFNEKTGKFLPDPTLGPEFAGGSKSVFRLAEDKNKDLWFHSHHRNIHALRQPDGTFQLDKTPFLRHSLVQVYHIYPDPVEETVWFSGDEGLTCYDKQAEKEYNLSFKTIIRKIMVNGRLIFDGYQPPQGNHSTSERLPLVFAFKDRNFSFEIAAPFFEGETETRYQYTLEGYDNGWSGWIRDTKIDYNELDAGLYRFRVQARNVYEKFGSEDVFQFKILLPWYRKWWAFLAYILIPFLMTYLVVKWRRSIKLELEKLKLEQIVKERTWEIEEKNQQLEKQTCQLTEQSEKLKDMDKVKSRFFANISHEFRTPLTLIMGPLEQMLSDCHEKKQSKQLNLMLRNSQRLLGLINQLLELSKFESGKMKLQVCRQNITGFLRGIVASFEPVAAKNELDLAFITSEGDITLYFDRGKLEEILFNILSNAVKFTPPGGKITVTLKKVSTTDENFPSGSVDISISDTGPGIPRDQLTHIFDRFYQSDITYEHHLKGSGIGLSIAKELVELHHGTIDVHSHESKGTEFIIRLPMGNSHLEPHQVIELPDIPSREKQCVEIPAFFISQQDSTEPDVIATGASNNHIPDAEKSGTYTDPLLPEKNTILVVEDSADVREYIRGELEPLYKVVEAKDGEEGIQKSLEIIPDLIVSDIMMPGKDGFELCRVLKNDINTSHIPILLLTAKASEKSIIQGLETGADDYITKPFNTKILLARIKNLIDLRTQMQQTLKREMTQQPVNLSVSHNDKRFIKKLKQLIDKNISDPDFNVTQLCTELDISQPTLYRKIYALSGESPTEFIRTYRLKRGAELLKSTSKTVLEVALEVGFSSANYFTKCFKKMFHQLPSMYQASEGE